MSTRQKHALPYRSTEVIWPASISKLLVSLIVSLGIGLSSLVNSSPAEAGGLLTFGGKKSRDSTNFRADTFDTASYKLKRTDAKIKLPDEYDGKEANYHHEEEGWMSGVLKEKNSLWYWSDEVSDDIPITRYTAHKVKIGNKKITELYPELVYDITPTKTFKQGEKVNIRGEIYGNKGDKCKIDLVNKDRETIISTRPKVIPTDEYTMNSSLRLTQSKVAPGKYYIKIHLGGEMKKTIEITVKATGK